MNEYKTMYQNNLTFKLWFDRLVNKAVSRYEWFNLPEEIDERFLELVLLTQGKILFFYSESLNEFVVMKSADIGPLDIYNVAEIRNAYDVNGYSRKLSKDDSVIIYNNPLRTGLMMELNLYAKKLMDIDRTIDVNIKAQKTPYIITCDESQKLTLKNMINQVNDNEELIMGDKKLDLNSLNIVPKQSPYVADKLQILKNNIYNECLTLLGVSTSNTDKKERLVETEVTANFGDTESERFVGLMMRRKACNQINAMFGLDIKVDYRSNDLAIDTGSYSIEEFEELKARIKEIDEPEKIIEGGENNE